MQTLQITISVPAAVANRIKKAAGAAPVSAWVTDIIEAHLNDAEIFAEQTNFVAEGCAAARRGA